MEQSVNRENFILLDAFLTNNESAMQNFYLSEFPKTQYFILKNGGSKENAKDIFQDAFFACWKQLDSGKFKPENSAQIEAYLFQTVKNKWIDWTRSKAKRKTVSIDTHSHQMVGSEEQSQMVDQENKEWKLSITLKAFEQLGQSCRDILTQFYFQKLSLRQIADKLNMEEASAKNKKYRCIQKLKELALQEKEQQSITMDRDPIK